jgi:hypothetical protein
MMRGRAPGPVVGRSGRCGRLGVGRDRRERGRALLALDHLLLELERLLLYLVDAARERLIHIGVRVLGGERVLAPVQEYLRDVSVLDHVDDDVRARSRRVLEEVAELAEVILDVRAQCGRNVYVSPRVLEVHTYPFRPSGTRGGRGLTLSRRAARALA